jgi:hypothetical protein
MKRLKSVETEQYSLEVIECDCGYHMGIDCPSEGLSRQTCKINAEMAYLGNQGARRWERNLTTR